MEPRSPHSGLPHSGPPHSDSPSPAALPAVADVRPTTQGQTTHTEGNVPLSGVVVAVQANYYRVQLDQAVLERDVISDRPDCGKPINPNAQISELLCLRRTRLKKLGQKIMVGDRVQVEEPDWMGRRGAVAAVMPRHSELDRPPVANADQILLVFAQEEPTLDPHQLSRFLAKAESTQLKILLGLSKSDLVSEEARAQWRDRLQAWGYDPFFLSLYAEDEFNRLKTQLEDKITILAGPSGVGKSSLINRLIPEQDLRVARVSGKLGRGRHTTRHVELFELPSGGLLADTPGFNQPQLDSSPDELPGLFPEIRERLASQRCQFSNCRHRLEPNCAVRGENPAGDWERYGDYLVYLEELEALQESRDRQADPEATLKEKRDSDGQVTLEPKLEPKRYRRVSRKSKRQEISNFTGDVSDLEQFLGNEDEDAELP